MTKSSFTKKVWQHYRDYGRNDLPWRQTNDPYHIWVSELMLQQTQVARVVPKYQTFIKRFPTFKKLAGAELREVLQLWQGLGYNRRAKYLHEAARHVHQSGEGLPQTIEGWRKLPGVGPYTATAIMVFAYGAVMPLIETNVRTVYLHHYFPGKQAVGDDKLWPHIVATTPKRQTRAWYYALMDYGAHLKITVGNSSRRSKHYTKQSTFAGSSRQLRGALIRLLLSRTYSFKEIEQQLPDFNQDCIRSQLRKLLTEGLVVKLKQRYALPSIGQP